MPALVVPGVRVEARFDVLPPLPAPSGIVGVAGIVDRPPAINGVVGVTRISEVREQLGPGTEVSMPEVIDALANGASEVVISPVAGGSPARLSLRNADSDPCIILRCRSNGTWGNQLAAEVRGVADANGNAVRVTIRLLRKRDVLESFTDLQVDPTLPDYLFDVLNQRSRLVVAIDPDFGDDLPAAGTYTFADSAPVNVPVTGGATALFQLLVADGASPTGLSVQIAVASNKIDVKIFQGGLAEQFSGLVMDPDDNNFLPFVLLIQSRLIRVRLLNSLAATKRLPAATTAPLPFTDGESPSVAAYSDAIDRLTDDPRIDLVMASIEPTRTDAEVRQIHQQLTAHAVKMAEDGAPRIAFGSVTSDEQKSVRPRVPCRRRRSGGRDGRPLESARFAHF